LGTFRKKQISGVCLTNLPLPYPCFRNKNKDELNLIAKEMAGEVEPEKFIEMYEYMALWRTKNSQELYLICKEMSGEVSPEKFLEVYDYIMSDEEDRHVFMFIDLHRKPEHPSMFRKNYTEFFYYHYSVSDPDVTFRGELSVSLPGHLHGRHLLKPLDVHRLPRHALRGVHEVHCERGKNGVHELTVGIR
jgi:hypothetical protein